MVKDCILTVSSNGIVDRAGVLVDFWGVLVLDLPCGRRRYARPLNVAGQAQSGEPTCKRNSIPLVIPYIRTAMADAPLFPHDRNPRTSDPWAKR
ncbi:hypothetical protein G7K_4258-t1 [Saitoella complicata NRRL Y-17804]|uniref:Uncharacterized protein n=1 Tax=Saitoella complicata (strain BCRC 22490 / CBS 7301 / JCM 7358 / NBRC 10748 / NRRL Y-17804) TaxID=698492 RepID=A0A0E9NJZ1_SAICN|nr:hypothetical protein G7K_4258-t1 [Saitoella complicata NRRL Y-17804]